MKKVLVTITAAKDGGDRVNFTHDGAAVSATVGRGVWVPLEAMPALSEVAEYAVSSADMKYEGEPTPDEVAMGADAASLANDITVQQRRAEEEGQPSEPGQGEPPEVQPAEVQPAGTVAVAADDAEPEDKASKALSKAPGKSKPH